MWAGLFPCRRTWVSRTDLKSWSRMRHEEMIFNIVAGGVMEPVRAPWRISESVSKSTSRIPTSHAKSIPSSMENLWVYFKVHVPYPYVPCKINSLFHGESLSLFQSPRPVSLRPMQNQFPLPWPLLPLPTNQVVPAFSYSWRQHIGLCDLLLWPQYPPHGEVGRWRRQH